MCFFSKHQLDDRNIFLFINTEFNRKKMYHDYQIKVYLDELQTHYTLVLINLIETDSWNYPGYHIFPIFL